jgi:hypothetical protein
MNTTLRKNCLFLDRWSELWRHISTCQFTNISFLNCCLYRSNFHRSSQQCQWCNSIPLSQMSCILSIASNSEPVLGMTSSLSNHDMNQSLLSSVFKEKLAIFNSWLLIESGKSMNCFACHSLLQYFLFVGQFGLPAGKSCDSVSALRGLTFRTTEWRFSAIQWKSWLYCDGQIV